MTGSGHEVLYSEAFQLDEGQLSEPRFSEQIPFESTERFLQETGQFARLMISEFPIPLALVVGGVCLARKSLLISALVCGTAGVMAVGKLCFDYE